MTTQENVQDLVTVNGVPAAEGLVALARAVEAFDLACYDVRRQKSKAAQARADKAFNLMTAKAAVVLGSERKKHLTKKV